MTDATQRKFNRCVRALGRLMQAEADQGLGVNRPKVPPKTRQKHTKWVSAFVDVRWFADAEGMMGKFRVVLADGTLHGLLDTTRDMKDRCREIWSVRKQDTSATWFGLKVSVSFDGEVSTELNHDPKCILDQAFISS